MNKSLLLLCFVSSLCSAPNNQRLVEAPAHEDQRILQIIRDYNKSERKKNKKDYTTLKVIGISFATALVTSMTGTVIMFKISNQ
jgi:hypothetical protein